MIFTKEVNVAMLRATAVLEDAPREPPMPVPPEPPVEEPTETPPAREEPGIVDPAPSEAPMIA